MGRVAVAIALGSNLGDRRGHLIWAVDQLSTFLDHIQASPVFETDAIDVPDDQPPYLNMAVVGDTSLTPPALMAGLLDLEQKRGRVRLTARAARTLDLDLVLYGTEIVDTPALVLPHPRFRDRRFVLEPLAAIAADWRDPVTGKTVGELFAELEEKEKGA